MTWEDVAQLLIDDPEVASAFKTEELRAALEKRLKELAEMGVIDGPYPEKNVSRETLSGYLPPHHTHARMGLTGPAAVRCLSNYLDSKR